MTHVFDEFPDKAGPEPGQCQAEDEEIAEWCAKTEHVLVTVDSDFRGRWIRSGLLQTHGVEVIVFEKDVVGLQEQHRRITQHLPHWQQELEASPYGHRVWSQSQVLRPRLTQGRKARARTRVANPTPASSNTAPSN